MFNPVELYHSVPLFLKSFRGVFNKILTYVKWIEGYVIKPWEMVVSQGFAMLGFMEKYHKLMQSGVALERIGVKNGVEMLIHMGASSL